MSNLNRPQSLIAAVYVYENGMVMAFDTFGQQMPQYQGHVSKVWTAIERDKVPDTMLNGLPWHQNYSAEVWNVSALRSALKDSVE